MRTERKKVNHTHECPICGTVNTIEFELRESPDQAPDGASPTRVTRESVVDYGECQAAARAANPRDPSPHDLATCPIFRSPLRRPS